MYIMNYKGRISDLRNKHGCIIETEPHCTVDGVRKPYARYIFKGWK